MSTTSTTKARLLPTSTPEIATTSLQIASSLLQDEQLVAFPTETVYGLGASALSTPACKSIYTTKGRPSDNPLIVHVSSRDMLASLLPGGTASIPPLYEHLMAKFWPGPLSLIFPLEVDGLPAPQRTLSDTVTASLPTVAIRMPSHPLALRLISESNLPLAAPSANLSSRPSPTTAQHVLDDLEDRGLAAVLDGGPCTVGLESTVVDFVPPSPSSSPSTSTSNSAEPTNSHGTLRVLRVGGVSPSQLHSALVEAGIPSPSVQVLNVDFHLSSEQSAKPTTPGMKYKHYSPAHARVVLVRRKRSTTSEGGGEREALPPPPPPSLEELLTGAAYTSPRIGLLLTDETLLALSFPTTALTPASFTLHPRNPDLRTSTTLLSYPLGSAKRPEEAAQRLFAGLRYFDDEDKERVDVVLVEVPRGEEGVEVAVRERMGKAAGGVGVLEFS